MTPLYNHYIPESIPFQPIPTNEPDQAEAFSFKNLLSFLPFGKKHEDDQTSGGLHDWLKRFHLDDLDAGDILLILIIIFLIVEGDNWELALILGLVFFLSLGDDGSV